MKRTPRALMLLALWIAALVILGVFVQRQLVIGTDLRLFLPKPTTPQQRLLLDEIGEGPASRMLVVALGGAAPAQLADASRALAEKLHAGKQFAFIANGEMSFESLPEELLPYRYLLSPTLDTHRYDADYLRSELEARERDLASPAGSFLEPWLPRDPTLELLKVLQRWQPMEEPRREFDVWFDREGKRALLIAQTQAPAFDPDRQRQALQALQQAFELIRGDAALTMMVSGAGKFSVMMEERTRGEAQALGTAATVGMIVLLLIAYRGIGSVILSALPLASAGLVGLAAVSGLFGAVHGITLAFGFTLIGVAQDYPIHLLSHRSVHRPPAVVAHDLWPTLATGVASTCIAYLTFVFSGVTGLAQLACFTVAGLAVAGLSTRFALPALVDTTGVDPGASAFLDRLWERIAGLPRMRWAAGVIAFVCIAVVWVSPHPFWENDLGKLTPVPVELIQQDQQLRGQLGAPDVRYLLVVSAPNGERALQRLEALEPDLQRLVERGALTGYDEAARYIPTTAAQRHRQERLPDQQTLRAALQAALARTSFRPDAFEPFVADVERARTLPPLTIERMASTPLGAGLQMLLSEREGKATALVTFSGVRDVVPLKEFATAAGDDVTLLDMKEASETLVANQRGRILWSLGVAAVLLIGVIAFALRSRHRVYRVLAPMALTTLLIIATLQAMGTSLTLFHLIALMLAAGLGLDYALFFEHASHDRAEQRRTLHAVIVCSLSTLMVFALLALSSLPVLRAIGVTVSLGVIFNFVLALLLTRPTPHAAD
jgi:predicted exporter